MKYKIEYGYKHILVGECEVEADSEEEAREKFDDGDYKITKDPKVVDAEDWEIEEIWKCEDE